MTNKRAPYYGFRMESDVLPESRADGRTCAGSRDPPTENPNLIFFFITPRDRLKALPLFTGKHPKKSLLFIPVYLHAAT